MKTSDVPAQVTNALAKAAEELRDIKPPVEIPTVWIWVLAGILALVLGTILWVAWFVWRNRTNTPPVVPVLAPHARARQRLQAALDLIGEPKPFCVAVSDAIRCYLEERFGLRAPERTTDEFLNELTSSDLLTAPQKESLREFLSACDLVKFARYEPGRSELQGLHQAALQLVSETEPQLVQSTPPPVPPTTGEAALPSTIPDQAGGMNS